MIKQYKPRLLGGKQKTSFFGFMVLESRVEQRHDVRGRKLGTHILKQKEHIDPSENLSPIGQTSSIEEKVFKCPRLWEAFLT